MMGSRWLYLHCIVLVAFASSSQAAIMVVQSDFVQTAANISTLNFTPTSSDSILVAATYHDIGGGAPTTISFGGSPQDGILRDRRTSLSYFLNPTGGVAIDIVATGAMAAGANSGVVVFELSGVDKGVAPVSGQDIDGADPINASITTSAGGMFVVDVLGLNPFGGTAAGTPDGDSIVTTTYGDGSVDVNGNPFFNFGGNGGGQLFAGTAAAGAAGSYSLGWNTTGGVGFGDPSELAYGFAMIPEPASMSLTLFAGLALLACRRRD